MRPAQKCRRPNTFDGLHALKGYWKIVISHRFSGVHGSVLTMRQAGVLPVCLETLA